MVMEKLKPTKDKWNSALYMETFYWKIHCRRKMYILVSHYFKKYFIILFNQWNYSSMKKILWYLSAVWLLIMISLSNKKIYFIKIWIISGWEFKEIIDLKCLWHSNTWDVNPRKFRPFDRICSLEQLITCHFSNP